MSSGRPPASVLRQWRPDDAQWYVAQVSDPLIQRFTTDAPDITPDDVLAGIARLDDDAGRFGRAIIDPETGSLAGNIAASLADDTAEISYWLAGSARGRGLARRAVTQTIDLLAGIRPGLHTVVLSINDDNTASTRLAEALGFRRDPTRDMEASVRESVHRRRGWMLPITRS